MKPIEVKALDNYKLWVKYDDGVEGTVDLSNMVGKGIFKHWNDYSNFQKVYIDSKTEAIAWNESLDICSTAVYEEITGKILNVE